MKWRIGSPSRDSRVVPSGRKPWFCCSRIARQRFVRGSRQWTHSRHCGEKSVTTWSPGASEPTPSPTALHDTGALVPQHRRRVAGRVGARRRVQIRMADAARDEADEDFARLRLREVDLLDLERPAELLQHRGPDLHAGGNTSFSNGRDAQKAVM